MKQLALLSVLLLGFIQSHANEDYGVLTDDGTLTIYYDDMRNNRSGKTFDMYGNNRGEPQWKSDEDILKIEHVVFDASVANYSPTLLRYLFDGCENLINIEGIHYLNTSNVKDMACMFGNCSSLKNIDVSNFNTSNVTDMGAMFYGCSSLKSIDVSNFDTSNVTDMMQMFQGCYSLISLDMSNFNTSNVTDMKFMFEGCEDLTCLDLSNFDTSNVITMWGMFQKCYSLTSLNVSNFDTSKVKNMNSMFKDCAHLSSLNLSNFDTSNVTDMNQMFACYYLTSVTIGKKFTQLPEQAFAFSNKIVSFTTLVEEPYSITSDCFTDNVKASATLYVPKGTKEKYEATPAWNQFQTIVEIGSNEVEAIVSDGEYKEAANYDLNGRCVNESQRGLNIVHRADGTVRKVIIK